MNEPLRRSVPPEPPVKPSPAARAIAWLGEALEWSIVHKVRGLAAVSSLLVASFIVFKRVYFQTASVSHDIVWQQANWIERFEMSSILGWGVVALLGSLVIRRPNLERAYEYLGILYFAFSFSIMGYAAGSSSMPTGAFMTGAPLMGFLLFRKGPVVAGMIVAAVMLSGASIAAANGVLPYAPMYHVAGFEDGRVHAWWLVTEAVFALPFILITVALSGLLLSRWRERERRIIELSITDPLTRIYNRRYVLEAMGEALVKSDRDGTEFSVVLVDLDHFKAINDTYGHVAGDRALVASARTLRQCVRAEDVVGRYGGEEFIILLLGTDREEAERVAERCRATIATLHIEMESGEGFGVTASMGVATYKNSTPEPLDPFVQRVDSALYVAKERGRNRVVAASESGLRDVASPRDASGVDEKGAGRRASDIDSEPPTLDALPNDAANA